MYASAKGDFSLALAGDCMLTQKISMHSEPGFQALFDLMRGADATFVNLETCVRNWDEGTPTITSGTPMTTSPGLLDELKWMGVDIVACANNHAFDYGEGGILATIRHLDEAGIPHAGTGRNLAEARMPGYVETTGGRLALVATTAAFRPWNQAGGPSARCGCLGCAPSARPASDGVKSRLASSLGWSCWGARCRAAEALRSTKTG